MECAEAIDWLSVYVDLPDDDPQRVAIERHIEQCESCAEQYRVWAVSEQWDDEMTDWSLRAEDWDSTSSAQLFRMEDVMERIYNDNPWFTPAHRRGNRMTPRMRNLFAGVVSFCLAVFLSGFLAIALSGGGSSVQLETGIVPTGIAGQEGTSSNFIEIDISEVGASDPVLLHVVPTIPQYWIALSLIGLAFALLLLNWLTRAKS